VVKYEFGKCRSKVIMTPPWQMKIHNQVPQLEGILRKIRFPKYAAISSLQPGGLAGIFS
jgi:hypothetical protein